MTLEVALDALTRDAVRWEEASAALLEMRAGLDDLRMFDWQFSFLGHGCAAMYAQLVEAVAGLLTDGARETRDASDELRQVRHVYETTDRAVDERMAALWQPLPN